MLFCAVILAVCASLPSTPPRFVFSGNDNGFIRPCGCSKPVLGGIARRGGMLSTLRAEGPIIPISTGNLISESGRQQQLKFESMLMAMSAMGYAVFAPGAGELALGVATLREAAAMSSFPFVCLNAESDGQLLFAPSAAVHGGAWVVTGLVAAEAAPPDVVVKDPVAALTAFAATLDSDLELVVLWNGPETSVAALVQALPEERRTRTVLAVSCVGDAPRPLEGAALAVAVGSKGRDVMVVQPGGEPFWRSVRLEESTAPDAECAAILDGYRDAVKAEDLLASVPRGPSPAFAGGASCRECHEDCTSALEKSAHMHALETLQRSGDDRDPECVRCHVVGIEFESGWTPERPQLANVDCEACHGPSEVHAQTQAEVPVGHPPRQSCLRCHDMDNSPQFDYSTYWPKIRHGR